MPASNGVARHVVARQFIKAWQVTLGLLVAALILLWLNQTSVRLYCQQKYHADCSVPGLNDNAAWDFGAQLTNAMDDARTAFLARLDDTPAPAPVGDAPMIAAEPAVTPAPVVAAVSAASKPKVAVKLTPLTIANLSTNDEVFFVGDSLMQGVAPHMANTLLKRYKINSVNLSKQSTGLAYPGFFNWPLTVQQTLEANHNIRLIVVFLGPNDPWDMPVAKGKPFLHFHSVDWEASYRQRVESIFELAKAHNVQVIWVGPPNMRKDKLSTAMAFLRDVYKSEAEHYGQLYLSANDVLGYHDDAFSPYMESADGKKVKTRVDDGIHFTTTGQKLIAERVMTLINVQNHDLTER
ncbi:SGNH/GDSL hydrolase family protein [Pseudomonas sp. M47T1]|uniref:SGNH/GDSL hydrolase family protein n=1 Tax=Pseudomonas sp. M47T1 TaxID=1179778 RepID=UPI0005B8678C|nr:SGNH family hydrolase [Pseudomonas sp. M47T1]